MSESIEQFELLVETYLKKLDELEIFSKRECMKNNPPIRCFGVKRLKFIFKNLDGENINDKKITTELLEKFTPRITELLEIKLSIAKFSFEQLEVKDLLLSNILFKYFFNLELQNLEKSSNKNYVFASVLDDASSHIKSLNLILMSEKLLFESYKIKMINIDKNIMSLSNSQFNVCIEKNESGRILCSYNPKYHIKITWNNNSLNLKNDAYVAWEELCDFIFGTIRQLYS